MIAVQIRNVLHTLIAGMVKYPEDIVLEVEQASGTIGSVLRVNQADMGVLMGTRGCNINALDRLFHFMAAQARLKPEPLRPDEATVGIREQLPAFVPRQTFPGIEQVRVMVATLAGEILQAACSVTHKATGKISTTYSVTALAKFPEADLVVVAESLNTLIHAHGKAKHGRQLFVAIKSSDEPAQPTTCEGRYA